MTAPKDKRLIDSLKALDRARLKPPVTFMTESDFKDIQAWTAEEVIDELLGRWVPL